MSRAKNQDSLKEIVDVFTKDYNSPIKAIVWAKAIKEWGHFIVGGTVCLLLVILIMFSGSNYIPNTNELPKDHQIVIYNLRRIVKFMDVTKKSVNERQKLYTDLMRTIDSYADDIPEQRNLQQKIGTLSDTLEICNTTRSIHMREFSHVTNPFIDPEIAASYARVAKSSHALPERKGSPITAQSEREAWNLLCTLCANEVQKAQLELAQLLNAQAR